MEYIKEIINITKIKEGFFIGDRTAGTNLDVVLQFKISHMINTTGSQILNQFETIGIKYLSLNWQENPNQKLIDSKDEIQNRLVNFIDNAIEKGEGILVYSIKGENRACILVILYFMKKYNWSLNKCIEFLKSKRKNVNIPIYFLKQLKAYESRIQNKISKEWYNLSNIKDKEEYIIRNTYLNSLIEINKNKNLFNINKYKCKYYSKTHVSWGDNNPYHKYNKLIINNNKKDLILQKNIKDVVSHLRLLPKKKSLKISNKFYIEKYNNYSLNNYYLNENYKDINNIGDKTKEIDNLSNFKLNNKIMSKLTKLTNNFNNLNLPKPKSNSIGKKDNKNLDFKKDLNKTEIAKNPINFSFQINNKDNYFNDLIKINNSYENVESTIQKISNKKKNKKQNKINNKNIDEEDYLTNLKMRRSTSFNNSNNYMNNSTNINQYINISYSLINNSNQITVLNNNQQNYFFQNNNSINFNMINNNHNNSFSKDKDKNDYFFEKKMFRTQQNFKKTKNQIIQQNPQNKMNNSANNFYNYNNKQKLNEYYNVTGQFFNNHSFIKNKQNYKEDTIENYKQFNRNHNIIINSILNENINPNINKININFKHNNSNNDYSLNKKIKRSSTPDNLLPKQYLANHQINYFNYSDEKKINYKNSNNKNKTNSNKSFNNNPRNQCKYLKYLIILL